MSEVSPTESQNQPIKLKFAGSPAPDDMLPGFYIVRCERGVIERRGNRIQAILSFIVLGRETDAGLNKQHEGVVLRQWYEIGRAESSDISIEVKTHSKYAKSWSLAMGRPFTHTDDPAPTAFIGKVFTAYVGFKSNDGSAFHLSHTGKRKDDRDFLRIHSLEKWHMGSYRVSNSNSDSNSISDSDTNTRTYTNTPTPTPSPTVAVTPSPTRSSASRVIGLRTQGKSMTDDKKPQGHASSAALAPSTAAAPALSYLYEQELERRKGVTDLDVVEVFGAGARLDSKNGEPVVCDHCGGPIVGIIEANGKPAWSCNACGRRKKR